MDTHLLTVRQQKAKGVKLSRAAKRFMYPLQFKTPEAKLPYTVINEKNKQSWNTLM